MSSMMICTAHAAIRQAWYGLLYFDFIPALTARRKALPFFFARKACLYSPSPLPLGPYDASPPNGRPVPGAHRPALTPRCQSHRWGRVGTLAHPIDHEGWPGMGAPALAPPAEKQKQEEEAGRQVDSAVHASAVKSHQTVRHSGVGITTLPLPEIHTFISFFTHCYPARRVKYKHFVKQVYCRDIGVGPHRREIDPLIPAFVQNKVKAM